MRKLAYLFGPYDSNKCLMAPPVTHVIVHNKPDNRTSWGHHGTLGWYIGLSLDYCRCLQCYMLATGIVRIKDTLQYITKEFVFLKTNHIRLFTEGHWRHNCNYEGTPADTSFLVLWWCNKNCNQSYCPHLAQKHISTTLKRFTLATTATTDSEWKYSTSKHTQDTSTNSWGETGFATSDSSKNSVRTHITSKNAASHITYLGSRSKSMDLKIYKIFEVTSDSKIKEDTDGTPESSTPFTPLPANFRQNFRTQASQHLAANHLFNLPHDFHVYNKQGGKETIDTLLL